MFNCSANADNRYKKQSPTNLVGQLVRFIENENPASASGKFHLKSGKSILGTLSKFINNQFKTRIPC